ncbi:MAG: hypothetical protein ACRENP_23075 [Longimicrobiales bacterium]
MNSGRVGRDGRDGRDGGRVTRYASCVALACALMWAGPATAQQSHLLIITGSAGTPTHSQQFHEWSTKLMLAATTKHGMAASNVVYLSEKPELGGGNAGRSTREAVEKAFTDLVARSSPSDAVLIVLIGHGSAEGGEARFNLPGPDLNAKDYQRLLEKLPGRKIGFVNTASASGAFLPVLTGAGRVVVTATRSGMERNETVFANHFVAAYTGDGADTDKDNKVSLLEAYNYAAREVERWYNEQNRLLTEHAQLDDDGDGKGVSKPDGRQGDGLVARAHWLAGAPAAVASNPELRALYDEKKQLEEKVATLRTMKASMEPALYERELEKLLVELAEKSQRIRQLEARK